MKQHGPWKIRSSETKYKNPWIEVREDQVIQPNGKPGIFGTLIIKAGVCILPLDDKGFVYLTKEFHYAVGHTTIEVVSGGIDKGENSLHAAKRELEEELGIRAEEWIDLGRIDPFTSYINSPEYLYIARKLAFIEASPEEVEIIEMLKISFDDALNMVMKSEITHGGSCALILKAARYLGKL